MAMRTGTLAREGLYPWAKAAVGASLLGMVLIALWAPYEVLDQDFQRISTTRRSILTNPEPGAGFQRLRLLRLLLEEGIAVSCTAIAVGAGRRSPQEKSVP